MIELVAFLAVPVVLIEMALVLALYLKVPLRQWLIPTIVLLIVWLLLPPHWFSSVIVLVLALAVIASHFYVVAKTRRRGLPVGPANNPHDKVESTEPVTPFPAINQGAGNEANYQELDQAKGEEEREGYDRASHPTKRASSKRRKKQKGRKGAGATQKPVSTSDLPTADKPTIEEYLKGPSNFFDDE
jgi:hypothetical protein